MRVLQLLPALKEGGVEKCAVDMARHLDEKGVDNWVASAGGPLVSELPAGTRHVVIPIGRKTPWAILANACRISRLIREERIDVVHALSRAPAWVGWIACRLMVRRPVRFVTTVHGAHGHGNALKRFYNSSMVRSDCVVATSQFIFDHICTVYKVPAAKILLAPRGINEARFDPAAISQAARNEQRAALGLGDQTAMLAMIGRLTPLKGHSELMKALSQVRDLDWHMVFVGSGTPEMTRRLQALSAELGLEKRITWTGGLSDVRPVLAATDLAFSASVRPEALGLTTIEAEAMEVPVIATAHGGSLETVVHEKTGWLVEPGNPSAMTDTIRHALSDRARLLLMGKEARRHVLANFTLQRMLEAESAAYETPSRAEAA
ncbi:glycosyltransferase family 4 protein [Agrobacterium sp. a22-2]|uniref:glycosyltransferase family 4 protein n=1 Tax=Agrobacterium sp. a22-2 TaxID=2283840 RepID=UPI00210F610E|nr:glycosyltransferase family 4 protein [Agrobacterium sp. a22-2]